MLKVEFEPTTSWSRDKYSILFLQGPVSLKQCTVGESDQNPLNNVIAKTFLLVSAHYVTRLFWTVLLEYTLVGSVGTRNFDSVPA